MKLLLCSRRRLLVPAISAALALPSAPADAAAFVSPQARLTSNKNTITRPPSVVTSTKQLMKKPEAKDNEPESKVTTADFATTDEEAEKMKEGRFQEEAFESDENSPATIDAARSGSSSKKKIGTPLEEKEDKKFDPTSLWTQHSQDF